MDLDWTLKGIDRTTGEIIWAVQCSRCGQTAVMPGVEHLSWADQDEAIEQAALVHGQQCPGRPA